MHQVFNEKLLSHTKTIMAPTGYLEQTVLENAVSLCNIVVA